MITDRISTCWIYAYLVLQGLHEFDPIAERIINVNAIISI